MLKNIVVIDERVTPRDELLGNAARAATGMDQGGLKEEQTAALLMRNDFALLEASRALATLGVYSVPLNWHNKPDELAYVIGDSNPSLIVGHADLLLAARDVIPRGISIYVVPVVGRTASECTAVAEVLKAFPGANVWTDWLKQFEPWTAEPKPLRSSIIYTSGTTGRPKAVRRDAMAGEALAKFRKANFKMSGIGPGTRVLALGPLYHSAPDNYARMAINEADLTVLQNRLNPEGVLQLIDRYKITHITTVPTVFVRLLKLPKEVRERYDVSSVRGILHTGGPCPPEIKRGMIEWFGPVINEIYGGTEMGVATFCSSQDWLLHPGSVGSLVEDARMVLYGDDGKPVPRGQPGEIYAYSPAYPDFSYLGNAKARGEVMRDGLISLGDVGYLNEQGFLFLCDRKRDMVISGGVNIYPAEVEAVLVTHPGVRDCAVYGIPDDVFGEMLIAAVERAPGARPSEEELKGFLEERLTNYKVPRRIEFHDTLPREDSGKIFKRKLRDPHWDGRSRHI